MKNVTPIRGDLDFDEAEKIARKLREKKKPLESASRFTIETLSQFARPELPKLVLGFIAHDQLVLVYGGWSAGKSFFVIDLLSCIAFGDLWRGRQCDPGLAIYIAGEAPQSIKNRIRAWCLGRGKMGKGKPEPPIGVIGCAPDLLNGDDDLAELIEQIEAKREATELPIRVIAIDTVHSCAPGSKEDAADFGTVLAKARRLSQHFGCAVVLVHHAGKDSSRGARGSVSIEAAADVIIEVTDDGDDNVRTPIVRKMRDGELPELEPFVIDKVMFNQDTPYPVSVGVHELTEPPAPSEDDIRRAKAREMRKDGKSYGDIAKALHASKSTVERWCKRKP
jgi:hypothetical protein